eukprot:9924789-Alexandrium_andersonii.AAC.1
MLECARYGFTATDATDAIDTWRQCGLVADDGHGRVRIRHSQVPPSLPDAWASATPPALLSQPQARRV